VRNWFQVFAFSHSNCLRYAAVKRPRRSAATNAAAAVAAAAAADEADEADEVDEAEAMDEDGDQEGAPAGGGGEEVEYEDEEALERSDRWGLCYTS
jgi:hypothetical protein